MKILFLTHNFPPEVNAPANRTHEHCRRWVADGHEVTVITGVPNHPRGVIFDGYKSLNKVRGNIFKLHGYPTMFSIFGQ